MRRFILSLALLATVSLPAMADAQNARVRIVATGGTIAGAQAKAGEYGYKAGAFDVQQLIDAVPNLNKLAVISVDGDSMEPTLRTGDTMLVDFRQNQPGDKDGIYVVLVEKADPSWMKIGQLKPLAAGAALGE